MLRSKSALGKTIFDMRCESASSPGLGLPISWWYIASSYQLKTRPLLSDYFVVYIALIYHTNSYSMARFLSCHIGLDLSHSFLLLMQTKILLTWQVEFPFPCKTQRQKSVFETVEYHIDNGIGQQIWCKRLCNRAIQFNSMSKALNKKANMEAKQFSPQNDLLDFVSQFNVFTFWNLLLLAFSCQGSSIPT